MKKQGRNIAAPLAAAALLAGCAGVPTAEPFTPVALRQCEALTGMTIPASAIGLPTRGAVVASAQRAPEVAPYRDAEGEHLLPTPARCLVLARILPVDAAAPAINIAVNLPLANWNGRALQSGGGGIGGVVLSFNVI